MQHDGYVQYGCGLCAPASWLNFDASPTLRLQRLPLIGSLFGHSTKFPPLARFGDVVKGLPIETDSCQALYCSHVLEHLSLADLRTALRNTLSYLKPGGVFRFVLPDLQQLATDYLASAEKQPAVWFMEAAHLGYPQRPRGFIGAMREWLGNSRHLWMWDERSMTEELRSAGFVEIRRAHCGDSGDPRFNDVEDPDRWVKCLGMQCLKR